MTTPADLPGTGSDARHVPVLASEAVALLRPVVDGVYVDCTLGLGGHTAALLESGAGQVIGIDRDESAIAVARERLAAYSPRVRFIHADYRDLAHVLREVGVTEVAGAIADLGVSSLQFDDAERGFSFRHRGPLDMRMDRSRGATAAERIAASDETSLADVIWRLGEERHSRRIARAIIRARDRGALADTTALAAVVRGAAGGSRGQRRTRIDPATRTFQALRIWVNEELAGLETFIEHAIATLRPGGRLAMIAFHSLEDRIVKHTFRRLATGDTVTLVTRKSVTPGDAEVASNPRARSARLRVVEKVA